MWLVLSTRPSGIPTGLPLPPSFSGPPIPLPLCLMGPGSPPLPLAFLKDAKLLLDKRRSVRSPAPRHDALAASPAQNMLLIFSVWLLRPLLAWPLMRLVPRLPPLSHVLSPWLQSPLCSAPARPHLARWPTSQDFLFSVLYRNLAYAVHLFVPYPVRRGRPAPTLSPTTKLFCFRVH